jgi:hypothetical protein
MANIQEQLKATGVAQVIAVLKTPVSPPGPPSALERSGSGVPVLAGPSLAKVAEKLEKHFVASEMSQDSALLRAAGAAPRGGRRRSSLERAASGGRTVPRARVYEHLGLMLGTVDRAD